MILTDCLVLSWHARYSGDMAGEGPAPNKEDIMGIIRQIRAIREIAARRREAERRVLARLRDAAVAA